MHATHAIGRRALAGLGLSLSLSLFAACQIRVSETIRGSGIEGERTPPVAPFESLNITGSFGVHLEFGPQPHLRLVGDENLLTYVVVEQQGEELRISVREGFSLQPAPRIELSLPSLARLELIGPLECVGEGLAEQELALESTGSGRVELRGECVALSVELTGSGDLALGQLATERARVEVTGSGAVELRVSSALSVEITGSAQVHYIGEPKVEIDITGSGRLTGGAGDSPAAMAASGPESEDLK